MTARKPIPDDWMAKEKVATRDMMVTVKSRLIQRAIMAEARRDQDAAVKYHTAAAHLDLLLADEYAEEGDRFLDFRSRLSAACGLWKAGQVEVARQQFATLPGQFPERARHIEICLEEMEQWSPPRPKRRATATKKKPRRPRRAAS